MLGTIREFWNDQRGIAMILVSIMLPVLVGFALLAIDMSRANGLHNDLQKGADAMALAAAGELDGRADSITRADRALANLVSNKYQFAQGDTAPVVLARAGVSRRYPTNISLRKETPRQLCWLEPASAVVIQQISVCARRHRASCVG